MRQPITCYYTKRKGANVKFEIHFFWFGFTFALGDIEDFYFELGE